MAVALVIQKRHASLMNRQLQVVLTIMCLTGVWRCQSPEQNVLEARFSISMTQACSLVEVKAAYSQQAQVVLSDIVSFVDLSCQYFPSV